MNSPDKYNFGPVIHAEMLPSGQLIPLRGFRLLRKRIWRWLTRPFRRQLKTVVVDRECGVTGVTEDRRWWRFL